MAFSLDKRKEMLSTDVLSNLRSYKYSSVDKSYISQHILRHYWNYVAEFMPPWLAPNVITLIGFAFIYTNVVCVIAYVPDLVGPGPAWLYYSFAAGLWLYSTMDNVDGKQARKTGSSSPLGELFDHGIDSLNCTLGGLIECACMGLGPTGVGAFITMVSCLAMYFSTWETYHTHTLFLGYINGPTEGIIIAVLLMVVSGIFGPEVWLTPVADVVPLGGDWILRDVFVVVVALAFVVLHLPFCVYNVYQARRRAGLPFAPLVLDLVPISVCTLATFLYLNSPYATVLTHNHLVLFALATSFAFGRVTTKIILAHLTKQPFPRWTIVMVPLIAAPVLFDALPRLGLGFTTFFEVPYLVAYLLFAAGYFLWWAAAVINAICGYLDINCFTIKSHDLSKRNK
ncbi:CDP-alcohol phosphatidyltransferase-domain-containing protein [Dipodascopsis tothii]|uniref:CDP-alcohol phosphatidyltransferase-domain-containing protein n=1 Tax=Dipodascopsis tothii TaxID=44089 RepID=UPI0034CD7940